MDNTPFHHSPAQILQDAQRAESSGVAPLAQQLYVQVVELYPTSPEAVVAQEGLSRVMSSQQAASAAPHAMQTPDMHQANAALHRANGQQNQPVAPAAHSLPSPQTAPKGTFPHNARLQSDAGTPSGHTLPQFAPQPAQTQPDTTLTGSFHNPGPNQHTSHPQQVYHGEANISQRARIAPAHNNLNLEPAANAEVPKRQAALKEPKLRRYSTGSILATTMIVTGTFIMIIGFALFMFVTFASQLASALTGGSSISIAATALALLVLGIVIIVNGLVARAVFANARALHSLEFSEFQRQTASRL